MRILFLCVANSARSQMAEGIARKLFGNAAEIFSAGSQSSYVHPLAVEVMQEIGLDISHQQSKSISSIDLASVDVIVTLCKEEICPIVSGNQQKYHWPLPDPVDLSLSKDEQIVKFRLVRDELKIRIGELKKLLGI